MQGRALPARQIPACDHLADATSPKRTSACSRSRDSISRPVAMAAMTEIAENA